MVYAIGKNSIGSVENSMNQLTGLLVEYLTIGSSTVLWITIAIIASGIDLSATTPALAILIFPIVYILGMVSDFVGHAATYWHKQRLKRRVRSEHGFDNILSQNIYLEALVHYPEIAKDISIRSSRDRVARGFLVNLPFIGISTFFYVVNNTNVDQFYAATTIMLATLTLTIVSYLMWVRFQKNSYRQELHVGKKILQSNLDISWKQEED